MRLIEPTPLSENEKPAPPTTSVVKVSEPKPTGAPPSPEKSATPPPGAGKLPWERFGPLTLDFRPVTVSGIELQLTRIPAFTSKGPYLVFPPFSPIQALDYGAKKGLALPCAEVFDALRSDEWWHAPITQGYDPSGDMQSDAVVIDHGRRWTLAMEKGYDGSQFIANVTKGWIADAVALNKPGYGVNRGYWMTKDAKKPIQERGQKHFSYYSDVAQGGIFVVDTPQYRKALSQGTFGNVPFEYEAFERATRGGTGAMSGVQSSLASYLDNVVSFFERLLGVEAPSLSIGKKYSIRAWKGNEFWSDADIRNFIEIADRAGINPADLLLVHLSETGGGNPAKWVNRRADGTIQAAGMMQWIGPTAKALSANVNDIATMSIEKQLPIVDAYLQKYVKGRGVKDAADLYMLNYTGGICRTESCAPKAGTAAYDHNRVLDLDGDNDIDLGDLRNQMMRKKRQVWDTLTARREV